MALAAGARAKAIQRSLLKQAAKAFWVAHDPRLKFLGYINGTLIVARATFRNPFKRAASDFGILGIPLRSVVPPRVVLIRRLGEEHIAGSERA